MVVELWKTPGFLASGAEEFSLGPVTRLDRSEVLCNKVLLKYERARESFWHAIRRGQKECPLLVWSGVFSASWEVTDQATETPQADGVSPGRCPHGRFWEGAAQGVSSPSRETVGVNTGLLSCYQPKVSLRWNRFEERQIPEQIRSFIDIA